MPRVELATDARYRYDTPTDAFVEVCPTCAADRAGTADECPCGHAFARTKRPFLSLAWEPARLDVRFPERCPHCLGTPTRTRTLDRTEATALAAGTPLGTRQTRVALEVPVCDRFRAPLLLSFLRVIAAFGFVLGLLAVVFHTSDLEDLVGGVLLVASALGFFALHKAAGWLRFARFDHRSYTFRVRRRAYAMELAERNGGRIR